MEVTGGDVTYVILLDTKLFYNDREHESKSLAVALYNMEKVFISLHGACARVRSISICVNSGVLCVYALYSLSTPCGWTQPHGGCLLGSSTFCVAL